MKWTRRSENLAVLLAAVALNSRGLGQQQSEQPLAAIQNQSTLSEEDRAAIRDFIMQRIGVVVGNSGAAPRRISEELREAYAGSADFKAAYASEFARVVSEHLGRADRASSAQMVALVGSLAHPGAHELVVAALQDERAGVRAAAAAGLRRMRRQLVEIGADAVQRSEEALRGAASTEVSTITLGLMYRAMDYGALQSRPASELYVAPLVELLVTRAERYASGGVEAWGADRVGLESARRLREEMMEGQQEQVIYAAALVHRAAILRYADGLDEVHDNAAGRSSIVLRNRAERLICSSEKLLETFLDIEKEPAKLAFFERRTRDTVKMMIKFNELCERIEARTGRDLRLDRSGSADPNVP